MTTLRIFVMALAVSVIVGGVVATAANAEEIPVRQRVALTIMPSAVDLDGDGITGSILFGDVRGVPGPSQLRGFSEFGLPEGFPGDPVGAGDDCGEDEVQLTLVTSDEGGGASGSVQTFRDLSQLFIEFISGHLCVDVFPPFATTTSFEGIFSGGTGRFEDASGDVTIDLTLTLNVTAASVIPLPPIGIAVGTGTMVGTLVLP